MGVGLPHRILAILDRAPSEQDPRDVVIEQPDGEIGRLRDDLARHKDVHRRNDGLQRQNERLRRENEHLKKQLGAERRAGRRQAAPFAKDRPQGRGGRPGRRPGARYGRQGRRPCPARSCASRSATLPWSRPMRPVGASAPSATGCGRPSPRRRPSTPSARAADSTTRKRSSGPTSTACSCATGWVVYRRYINGEHQSCLQQYPDIRIMAMSAQTPAVASGICADMIGIITAFRERPEGCRGGR